jgi:glycosyltransferase involved in cell wall biosynthesis
LAYRKGVDVLLQAAAKQRTSNPDQANPPHYVICGDGTERSSLESLSTELGLAQQVTFMGNVKGMTKLWLLQNAYNLVIPSRQWEAYPMVLLEGFAAKCPVIASDAPGLHGLVHHQETGWVVPRENPAALAEMLTTVWRHPSMTSRVAQNGQRTAQQCDWQGIAEKHIDLFETLTEQKQPFTLRIAG